MSLFAWVLLALFIFLFLFAIASSKGRKMKFVTVGIILGCALGSLVVGAVLGGVSEKGGEIAGLFTLPFGIIGAVACILNNRFRT